MYEKLLRPSKVDRVAESEVHFFDFGPPRRQGAPSFYMQSQVHGNEVFGTLVVRELMERLSALPSEAFLGALRISPSANPFSYQNFLIAYEGMYDLLAGKNWNRIFDVSDVISENMDAESLSAELARLAEATNDCVKKLPLVLLAHSVGYNYVVDVHTPEFGMQHLYCDTLRPNTPTFGINNVVESGGAKQAFSFDDSNQFLADKLKLDCVSVTVELPSYSPATHKDVVKWADAFAYELVRLGLVDGKYLAVDALPEKKPVLSTGVYDFIPDISGIVLHHFAPCDTVEAGAPLVSVIPMRYDAKGAQTMYARKRCFPVSMRRKGTVQAGQWVVRVLEEK